MIDITKLPSMDIPGILKACIGKLDESKVKEEERAAVKSAREVAESVLHSHESPSVVPLENPSGLLRSAARSLRPLSDVQVQSAMLGLIAAADLIGSDR